MKIILGISAFYHDGAAAVISDGNLIAAAQEERFTRIKHTSDFPVNAITYCLKEAGLNIDDLDAVVFYDKPFLKFERLLQTYYTFAPRGIFSFLKAIPIWLGDKLFLKRRIIDGLKQVGPMDKKKIKLLFSEHHLSHGASAFYCSRFKEAAILTIDGVGEWSTATIGFGKKEKIEILKELHFPHSVGLLYSAFTYYLGFKVNSGEYKVMGLAPYGQEDSKEVADFISKIKSNIVSVKPDGSIWLNQAFFSYPTGLKMTKNSKWEKLFGFARRVPESELRQQHCNLAMAIQKITEEIVLKMAVETKKVTGAEYLCMAGGVALNCVANGKLLAANIFKDIFIQPAAGDAGGALGAAMAAQYMYFNETRKYGLETDIMQGCLLGPEYTEKEVLQMNRKTKAIAKKIEDFDILCKHIASKLADGKIIGWFQGRMEYGPRALGNRSILADPSQQKMQQKLNLKIKNRESFRPFAPSVLEEDSNLYFENEGPLPYMLFTTNIKDDFKKTLPIDYHELPLKERLAVVRSDFPAITHIDFSARTQTVAKSSNPRYWKLINAYKEKSGHGILINTSFNVRGAPIVCSPLDAYQCFMATAMDYLVIGDFVYDKKEQLDWQLKEKWQLNNSLD
ncbi:MAG: carbamoyltransferase [Flavobacteriaceae bacterium]